ncbi:MAG: hypothetical protein WCD11_20560 [Solirubrobacteraceae bacterium]
MREYGFTITGHDRDRPWMVLVSEHRTIELPDGLDFFTWADRQWPGAAPGRLSSIRGDSPRCGRDDLSFRVLDLIARRRDTTPQLGQR